MIPVGRRIEQMVADRLKQTGWSLLAQNYRCVGAELDIIAQKQSSVVGFEVKYRSVRGPAQEIEWANLISPKKRRSLLRGLQHFLTRHPDLAFQTLRLDLILVREIKKSGEYLVTCVPNIHHTWP